jgi:hypothetical protein
VTFYTWSPAQRQAVILHELAHVRRRDYLTHLLAYAALALNWFNPLAHLAFRRLHVEREQAADNAVLDAGMAPTEYAGQLLAVAWAVLGRTGAGESLVVASMARNGEVRERIEAVLRRNVRRRALARWEAVTTGAAALLLALPVVALSPWHEAPAWPADEPASSVLVSLTFDAGYDLGATDQGAALPPFEALMKDKNVTLRVLAVQSLGDVEAAGVAAALIEALYDENYAVRAAAAYGLGHRRESTAVPDLLDLVARDGCFDALAAAWALGEIGRPEAVEPLMQALAGGHRTLRLAAAVALGRIGDPRALDALAAARYDECPEVRRAAAQAQAALARGLGLAARRSSRF